MTNARCHPERPEHPENYGDDHFCRECFFKAWNAGADWADAHWADQEWLRELRTGNPGETLGMEGREAGHAYLTRIAKEKGRND